MFQKVRVTVLIMIGMVLFLQFIHLSETQAAMKIKVVPEEKYILQVQTKFLMEEKTKNSRAITQNKEDSSFDNIEKFLNKILNDLKTKTPLKYILKFKSLVELRLKQMSFQTQIKILLTFGILLVIFSIYLSIDDHRKKKNYKRRIENKTKDYKRKEIILKQEIEKELKPIIKNDFMQNRINNIADDDFMIAEPSPIEEELLREDIDDVIVEGFNFAELVSIKENLERKEPEPIVEKQRLKGIFRVDKMDGSEFERFLVEYFTSQGNSVKIIGGIGDYGGDMIVYPEKEPKFIVQAKRSNGKIDLHAVQEVLGAKSYYNVSEGWVITNSYFTKNARILAASANIKLWNRDDIIQNITKDNIEEIKEENEEFFNRVQQNECPMCQGRLILKTNQTNGKVFVGCTNYPDCTFTDDTNKSKTKNLTKSKNPLRDEIFIQDEILVIKGICPRCGRKLVTKNHYGRLYTSCIGWGIFNKDGERECQWSIQKYY